MSNYFSYDAAAMAMTGEAGCGGVGPNRKRVDHIFRKYPDLLSDFNHINNDTFARNADSMRRVLTRKDAERHRKLRRARKLPFVRLRQFGTALLDAIGSNQECLFTCPVCRKVLNDPVTVECGHTFCKMCLLKSSSPNCPQCFVEFDSERVCINVLVQHIVTKWRASNVCRDSDEQLSPMTELMGLRPRYQLRSRYAGLQANSGSEEEHIDKLVRHLLIRKPEGQTPYEDSQPPRKKLRCSENRQCSYFNHADISSRENVIDEDHLKDLVEKILHEADDLRYSALKSHWNQVSVADLECILCSSCFLQPVTTRCGHTFCKGCLARVLDHGLNCPLCMSSLTACDQARGTTAVLEQALSNLAKEEHEERLQENRDEIDTLEKVAQVPVFVCTSAFPGVACPLYVYEPRYRLLARRCLQSTSRKFAMAALIEGRERFASYGTLLEVKDAVHLEDGRTILTTVGVRRYRVTEKGEQDGYDTASIQYIRDAPVIADRIAEVVALHERVYYKANKWVECFTPRIQAEVDRTLGAMPPIEPNWITLPDGPAWAWWLMPILPLNSQLQVGFLRATSLEKRLRAIEKMLEHMKVRMRALENNCLKCAESVQNTESCSFTEHSNDIPCTTGQ